MTHTTHQPIGATVLGYPRIGRDRELKKALDAHWAGRISADELAEVARHVRIDAIQTMAAAGLDSVPVNTFSRYDQMLDTAVLTGVVADADYFTVARGNAEQQPWEMTKWFDTNYHYLVPEIGAATTFGLNAAQPLAEYAEATELGVNARPVVMGPFTFLSLAKSADGVTDPLSRLDELVSVYIDLLAALAEAGVAWLQLDEPAVVADMSAEQVAAFQAALARLVAAEQRPAILLATYFAPPVDVVPVLFSSGVEAVALDLVNGVDVELVRSVPGVESTQLVLGVIDGHNIWRAPLRARWAELNSWRGVGAAQSVSSSCSLLHVPIDVERESELDPALKASLAFADQKLAEVVALQRAWDGTESPESAAFVAADHAVAQRRALPGVDDAEVAARVVAVGAADRQRVDRAERVAAQQGLGLPLCASTTIGSFPQTAAVRTARAAHRAGRLDEAGYLAAMRAEVESVIELQTAVGLDVLVHGEPERNDMVQYFAEQLNGFAATQHGWVQSYGSRCVRPPIVFGDVSRPEPMTVEWARYAQSLTDKPVKGMLTGPVTMLAWSFVRDDQPRSVTADQVALALRDEVTDLEAAGISIIQVDEPALRETMPLRAAEQESYLAWAVAAFRLATAGVRPDTQIHTHLCYSEFGEIIEAIDGLDADVTSIEAARSRMELLGDLAERGFGGALGPGVYDIHSPRVPSVDEMVTLLKSALQSVPAEKLWVNPDCGLKTRGYAEVEPALRNLVEAARIVRAELEVPRSV